MLSATSAPGVGYSLPRNSHCVGEMLKPLSTHYPKTMAGGYSGPWPQDTGPVLKYSVSMRNGGRSPSEHTQHHSQRNLNTIPSSLLACPEPAGMFGAGEEHRTTPEVITLLLSPSLKKIILINLKPGEWISPHKKVDQQEGTVWGTAQH